MKKVKCLFLTGFLGAGKTTAALQLLGTMLETGSNVRCIVNDLGAVNVDAERFKKTFPSLDIADLSGACIGCNGRDEFYPVIERFHAEGVEALIIEATGVLTGNEMRQIANDMQHLCDFKVVTMLHVPRVIAGGVIERAEMVLSQLREADIVGLTWTNQLPNFEGQADPRLTPVHQLLGAATSDSAVEMHIIPDPETGEVNDVFLGALLGLLHTPVKLHMHPLGCACGHNHNHDDHHGRGTHHDHHSHAHDAAYFAWSGRFASALTKEELVALVMSVHKNNPVLRAKGDIAGESFDFVNNVWKFSDIQNGEAHSGTIITTSVLPQEVIDRIAGGPLALAPATTTENEVAVRELLGQLAPIQPTPDSVLALDGQTYLAWSIATKPGAVSLEVRALAVKAMFARLLAAAQLIGNEVSGHPVAARTVGAYLPYFTLQHKDELPQELTEQILVARPEILLAHGLLALKVLGQGTGVTGATVRPEFLSHALNYTKQYAPQSVPLLRHAFTHCVNIAADNQREGWATLIAHP